MSVLFVVFIPVEDEELQAGNTSLKHDSEEANTKDVFNEKNNDKINTDFFIAESDSKTPLLKSPGIDDGNDNKQDDFKVEIETKSSSAVMKNCNSDEKNSDVKDNNAKEKLDNDVEDSKGNSKVEFTQQMSHEFVSLEQALQNLLGHLIELRTDVWQKSDDNNHWQINFVIEADDVDFVLTRLCNFGIGSIPNTSVSIFPASYHNSAGDKNEEEDKISQVTSLKKEQEEFMKSVKSRLTVAQVVEAVKTNSKLSFDFVVLIILAGIISALGLIENSSVILVASMLVSPLMGPILGGTFGLRIRNGALFKLGVRNETIGLVLCIAIGFIIGIPVAAINSSGAVWPGEVWPTSEMQSRGLVRSLWVGILIALPSGAGVAISILGGNTGSLVGVAISASLLPPAVNSGMLLAYGLVSAIHPPHFKGPLEETTNIVTTQALATEEINITTTTNVPSQLLQAECGTLENNDYKFYYSCNMAVEATVLATVSLTLTLLNIICIFIMGVLVLKLKEVAPHTAVSDSLEKFWKSDMPVARDAYKTMKTTDPKHTDLAVMAKQIAKEEKEKKCVVMHSVLQEMETDKGVKDVLRNLTVPVHEKSMIEECPKVIEEVLEEDEYHPYHTIGPSTTRGRKSWWSSTSVPNSPVWLEENQKTWMKVRHRKLPGLDGPHTAGILDSKITPFKFPIMGHAGSYNLHERKPRGLLSQQKSTENILVKSDLPKSQSGRFEITTIPETEEQTTTSKFDKNVSKSDEDKATKVHFNV